VAVEESTSSLPFALVSVQQILYLLTFLADRCGHLLFDNILRCIMAQSQPIFIAKNLIDVSTLESIIMDSTFCNQCAAKQ